MKKVFLIIAIIFANNIFAINTPTQSSPTNGSSNINLSITLWINQVSEATNYDYQFDTIPTFDSPSLQEFSHSDVYSGWTVSDLLYEQKYYWRVRGRNDTETSSWSDTWNFTTKNYGVMQQSPENNATDINPEISLYIYKITGSENYDYQFDTVPTFDSPSLQEFSHTDVYSGWTVSDLLYGQKYYWRVRGRNDADTSNWTDTWNFTTNYEMTTAPILVAPTDNSNNISYTSFLIDWDAISNANNYQYQISITNDFTNIIKSGNTSLTDKTISDLQPNTTYYWRVRGENVNGYSPWSLIWNFTTETLNIDAPTLISPTDNTTNQSINPTLTWDEITNATSYEYQYSKDELFSTYIGSSTENTSISIETLDYNTKYFWRIKATDGTSFSEWSEVWSFTTESSINVDNIERKSIALYPNPAKKYLKFKTLNYDFKNIKIYDIYGKLVISSKFKNEINISELNSGTYLIIFENNKNSEKRVFIKK